MNKPVFINMANPSQTKAEADDQALELWAAMQVKSVNMGVIGRHTIDAAVEKMPPAEQVRAKHWLNHFRIEAKKGGVAK